MTSAKEPLALDKTALVGLVPSLPPPALPMPEAVSGPALDASWDARTALDLRATPNPPVQANVPSEIALSSSQVQEEKPRASPMRAIAVAFALLVAVVVVMVVMRGKAPEPAVSDTKGAEPPRPSSTLAMTTPPPIASSTTTSVAASSAIASTARRPS